MSDGGRVARRQRWCEEGDKEEGNRVRGEDGGDEGKEGGG